MDKRGLKRFPKTYCYILFMLFVVLCAVTVPIVRCIYSIDLFLNLDNHELLITIWQIQALVISFSFLALTLMQTSFNIRIYGQRISRVEANRMLNSVLCSLLLIFIMAIPVVYNLGVLVILIFIVSLSEVANSFMRVFKIINKPHVEKEKVNGYIDEITKNFLMGCEPNSNVYEEFEDMISYLISHIKELFREENYIELRVNLKKLKDVVTEMRKHRITCNKCNTCEIIYFEYEDIKAKCRNAKLSDFTQ